MQKQRITSMIIQSDQIEFEFDHAPIKITSPRDTLRMISYSLNEAGPLFTVLKNCNTITTDRADKLSNTGEKLDCIIIRSFELYRPDVIYEWVIHVLGFSKYKKNKKQKTQVLVF